MAEYIEREKLLQDISECVVFTVRKGTPLPNAEMRGANKVIDRVKSAPTEDVVKVVRCCDCKHFKPLADGSWINQNRTDGICYALVNYHDSERYCVRPDHFCSYGELKGREG